MFGIGGVGEQVTLDAVGDRWALLIVRDLHAGPARFHDLETGLGIATNLLSTRLRELTEAGLIEKSTDVGRGAYQLTELGRELGRLHSQHCTYFGSAPVTLEDYIKSVKAQSLTKQSPTVADLTRYAIREGIIRLDG